MSRINTKIQFSIVYRARKVTNA